MYLLVAPHFPPNVLGISLPFHLTPFSRSPLCLMIFLCVTFSLSPGFSVYRCFHKCTAALNCSRQNLTKMYVGMQTSNIAGADIKNSLRSQSHSDTLETRQQPSGNHSFWGKKVYSMTCWRAVSGSYCTNKLLDWWRILIFFIVTSWMLADLLAFMIEV